MQQLLDGWRTAYRVPGVAAYLAYGDGRVVAAASGVADLSSGAPLEPDMRFETAGITKTFVAALCLLLASEGGLALDEPIARYLPYFPGGDLTTLRLLLGHRSGLYEIYDDPEDLFMFATDLGRAWSAAELARMAARQTLRFRPGTAYRYTDTAYVVTVAILEQVTGASLAELLGERCWQPLGLAQTFLCGTGESQPAFLSGYLRCDDPLYGQQLMGLYGQRAPCEQDYIDLARLPGYQRMSYTRGGAGVVSTAPELARWARAMGRGEVVPEPWFGEMVRFDPRFGNYGLGVAYWDTPLGPALGHAGNALGLESLLLYLPQPDLALVLFANGGPTHRMNDLAFEVLRSVMTPAE